jgi:hypothetical protein
VVRRQGISLSLSPTPPLTSPPPSSPHATLVAVSEWLAGRMLMTTMTTVVVNALPHKQLVLRLLKSSSLPFL